MAVRLRPASQAGGAVVLRYYEDLSEKATAEILGVSVGTVKSSCSAALRTLRTSITASEGGPR